MKNSVSKYGTSLTYRVKGVILSVPSLVSSSINVLQKLILYMQTTTPTGGGVRLIFLFYDVFLLYSRNIQLSLNKDKCERKILIVFDMKVLLIKRGNFIHSVQVFHLNFSVRLNKSKGIYNNGTVKQNLILSIIVYTVVELPPSRHLKPICV